MDMMRDKLLKEIMAADFTLVELNLYLNTHPSDCKAVAIFNCALQNSKILKYKYECTYGSLTAGSMPSKCPWQWIESPWPWECQ